MVTECTCKICERNKYLEKIYKKLSKEDIDFLSEIIDIADNESLDLHWRIAKENELKALQETQIKYFMNSYRINRELKEKFYKDRFGYRDTNGRFTVNPEKSNKEKGNE